MSEKKKVIMLGNAAIARGAYEGKERQVEIELLKKLLECYRSGEIVGR